MATPTMKRVTYPLSAAEVEELQQLAKSLKQKATDAQTKKRVGLHRAYTELMKETARIVTRETNRMSREDLAEYNRQQFVLKQEEKARVASNGSTSTSTPDDDVA